MPSVFVILYSTLSSVHTSVVNRVHNIHTL